jgi:conjugal transfer pilin signal peptidase TrbI
MRHLVRLTFVLLALLMLYAVLGLASNNSPSEPRGLYRLTHEPLQRGRYVVLKMPLKQIAAVPGDTVRTAPEGSYVNGKLWPKSAIPAGVQEHFPFGTYVLQPGQLWVLGDHPLSFDSRYFGMVPDTLVNATAEPLLTTEE